MLQEIINKWKIYCVEENFVGIGSTRKVFRVWDYVIKVHIHSVGHKQSQKELEIYEAMVKGGQAELFAQVFHVDENIAIQRYYEPLELVDNQSFEINTSKHKGLLPENYNEVFNLLDTEFDSFDLKDSSNYGLNKSGKLIFIDYGMTKRLYEDEWVPLAEAGVLPQIDFAICHVCGLEDELRMYGEDDLDKRCYACGKE